MKRIQYFIPFCCFLGTTFSQSVQIHHPPLRHDYPIHPVPFADVRLTDHFWKPRIDRMYTVTLPHELDELRVTGRDRNFQLAALALETHVDTAHFCTEYPFDDTDLYKVIEGISYALMLHPDPLLKKRMDSLIDLIAAAQEPDGYLYTARTINPLHPHSWSGLQRWEKVEDLSHELYNSGHLFQAAAANYIATGDKKLLDVAVKNANLLCNTFGWGKLEKYPGHPEVELGLVSLYRVTGDVRYLQLAKFFLDVRGPGGSTYEQAQQKVVDQRKAVGHAVRAGYLYAAMADVSAFTGDTAYVHADRYIWNDIVSTQLYVTGGVGATSNGEAFGQPYELPNLTAYNETCASIANVYFNERMFLTTGNAAYYDVLERTLYNALLSGLSLHGDEFFYPNPLASMGQYARSPWFGCSCCPTNLARFIPVVSGYFYATSGNQIYVNLYGANQAAIHLPKQIVHLNEQTDYPWSGTIRIDIQPEQTGAFTLKLRIPGWATNKPVPSDLYTFVNTSSAPYTIQLNGQTIHPDLEKGYAVITRTWKKGDQIVLHFPMDVRVMEANPQVKADVGRIALQRGPLVYCLEWPDNADHHVLNLIVDPHQRFTTLFKPDLLDGVQVIQGQALSARRTLEGKIQTMPVHFTAIPYYAWANRGPGEMTVWMAASEKSVQPLPAPTLAYTSTIRASRPSRSLIALHDQQLPDSSNDHSVMYFHWWPEKDTTVWVEYDFKQPATISSSGVYWYDDHFTGGGCSVPDSWQLLYQKDGQWISVENITSYTTDKDRMNVVKFKPVYTSALRMMIRLNKNYSTGIYEWEVK
ncbi:MAG: glycoside hydrolase family 127 protein [Thermoflavifilum aggregans]|nr:glycoside hydrolase family 127 protein [Thermoflavifilum aggregans]